MIFFPDLDIWVFRQNHVRPEGVPSLSEISRRTIGSLSFAGMRISGLISSCMQVASLVDVAAFENYFCPVVTWTLAFGFFFPAAPFP